MNNPMMGMNNQMMGMNNQMVGMNNPMMGMNNQMVGMNNQMNDDISSRIKIIIEPYEKKIKDLEDQLRKKDFEIVVLKEKLFKAEKNSLNDNFQGMNPFNMNMGMIPPMINPIMNPINEDPDIINLIFRFGGEPIKEPIKQRCFIDDEFGFVQKKILKKLNITGNGELKFIFNAKKANPKLTIAELGIADNANIFVVNTISNNSEIIQIYLKEEAKISDIKTIVFKSSQGANIIMNFESHISIGSAIQKFLMKINKEELISSPSKRLAFLYNAKKYDTKDTISLKSLFKGNQVSSMIVNDIENVIGA